MGDSLSEHECHFFRSLDNRRFILTHRRKRLNSAPTRILQTDDEILQQTILKNSRDTKFTNMSSRLRNHCERETVRRRLGSFSGTLSSGGQKIHRQQRNLKKFKVQNNNKNTKGSNCVLICNYP